MTGRQKRILLGATVGGVLLVVVALCVSLATLNSRWLHDRLIAKAASALDAELTIESLEFHPFQGRAALTGAHLVRSRPASELDVRVADARLEVRILPLLFRYLSIRRLELTGPAVRCERALPARVRSPGTLTRIKRLAADRIAHDSDGSAHVEVKVKVPPDNWNVGELLVRDGRAEYLVTRPDEPPFRAAIASLDYAARDVSLHALTNLLNGADMRGTIEMRGTATLKKIGSQTPGTLAIRGLNLAALDDLLDPTDALELAGGTLDVSYTAAALDKLDISVALHELEVAQNPDAASDEFLFIPVEKLREHVARHGQRLDLAFAVDAAECAVSDDLVFIAEEFWEGMLTALMKDVGARTKDELPDKSAEKLSGWLERKAAEQP
jgi:hypothetical protein